jgi:hypothetical protein
MEGCWGEKYHLVFIDEMSRKTLIKTLQSRSKAVATTLKQRSTQTSLICLKTMEPRTTKPKFCSNHPTQIPQNVGPQDLRILATRLKSLEKEDLRETLLVQEWLNLKSYD